MNTYLRIFFTVCIALVLTFFAYNVSLKCLEKYYGKRYARMREIFVDTSRYDIIFIGSSRTHTAINPRIIDSITGWSSYNAGVEGGTILDFKMTLEGYLVHHPVPRMLVLTIDPGSFAPTKTVFDPAQYFSLVKKNRVLDQTFSSLGYKTFIFKKMPMFGFIYMDEHTKSNMVSGLIGKTEMFGGQFQYKGYLSETMKCIDTLVTYQTQRVLFSPQSITLFDTIVDICKKNNIRLIITYAPEYRFKLQKSFDNFKEFTDTMYKKTQTGGLLYCRDDSLAMNGDPCLFKDRMHVNYFGAQVYSGILGERLKPLLTK